VSERTVSRLLPDHCPLAETRYFLRRLSLPVSADNVRQYAPQRYCPPCRHSVQPPNAGRTPS
jgi:hypothetical protein